MHIEHINISAPLELLEKVKKFYCEVFDLKEGFRPTFRRNGFWLYSGGNAILHLTESYEHSSSEGKTYLDHVAFQTTGLKTLIEKLTLLNVEHRCDSFAEIGMTQVFFKDPAGLKIEVNFLNEALQ